MEEKPTSKSKFSSTIILEGLDNLFHLPCPSISTFHLCRLYGKFLLVIVYAIIPRQREGFGVSKCFSSRFQPFGLQLRQLVGKESTFLTLDLKTDAFVFDVQCQVLSKYQTGNHIHRFRVAAAGESSGFHFQRLLGFLGNLLAAVTRAINARVFFLQRIGINSKKGIVEVQRVSNEAARLLVPAVSD